KFPHLHTQTIEAEPSECFDFLLSGDADIGIIVAAPDIPAGGDDRFSQHFLIDDPLDLMVPLDHPLADRDSVSIGDTVDETWIMGRPGTTYHQLLIASCAAAGFKPRIAHFAHDWNTGTALVSAGLGRCVACPLSRSQELHPVRRIPLSGDNSPSRHGAAVTRAGADTRETVRFTLETLAEEAQRLMGRFEHDLTGCTRWSLRIPRDAEPDVRGRGGRCVSRSRGHSVPVEGGVVAEQRAASHGPG